jgi:rSAM/selenodomain-associated transferase 1
MRRGRLVVFAKAPRAGSVKTRLVPPLSPAEAADLYGAMLDDVLDASARAALRSGLDPILAVHPPAAAAELARRVPDAFRVVVQRGADLAQRMAWAVGEAGAAGAWPVVLRGSDSPALAPSAVEAAVAALARDDVAIVPDLDGGYSLIGLRRVAPGLFEHPMSTASVCTETCERALALGLRVRLLEPCFDVDRAGDLALLADARRRGLGNLLAHTLACMDRHTLWRHLDAPAHASGSG